MAVSNERRNDVSVTNILDQAMTVINVGNAIADAERALARAWEAPASVSFISDAIRPAVVEIRESGEVIVGLGDMAISYFDPTKPSMSYKRSVSNKDLAVTRSLFDTIVASANPKLAQEERLVLKERELRLKGALYYSGRSDILRASQIFGSLPGVGQNPLKKAA